MHRLLSLALQSVFTHGSTHACNSLITSGLCLQIQLLCLSFTNIFPGGFFLAVFGSGGGGAQRNCLFLSKAHIVYGEFIVDINISTSIFRHPVFSYYLYCWLDVPFEHPHNCLLSIRFFYLFVVRKMKANRLCISGSFSLFLRTPCMRLGLPIIYLRANTVGREKTHFTLHPEHFVFNFLFVVGVSRMILLCYYLLLCLGLKFICSNL